MPEPTSSENMVVTVESFHRQNDHGDQAAWQRAVDFAAESDGWVVRGTRAEYLFRSAVRLPTDTSVMLEGSGDLGTTIRVMPSAGRLENFFTLPPGRGGTVSSLGFRNLRFHGGLVSATDGQPERDERVFGADWCSIPIRVRGSRITNAEG